MAAVLIRGEQRRAVIGAMGGKPLLLEGEVASEAGALHALGDLDPVQRHMQITVLRRALAKADA